MISRRLATRRFAAVAAAPGLTLPLPLFFLKLLLTVKSSLGIARFSALFTLLQTLLALPRLFVMSIEFALGLHLVGLRSRFLNFFDALIPPLPKIFMHLFMQIGKPALVFHRAKKPWYRSQHSRSFLA